MTAASCSLLSDSFSLPFIRQPEGFKTFLFHRTFSMNIEIVKEKLPSPWASYLVNGVNDSLEEGEEKEIAETLETLGLSDSKCIDVLDDASFSSPPIYLNWLLAGDYSTFVFYRKED